MSTVTASTAALPARPRGGQFAATVLAVACVIALLGLHWDLEAIATLDAARKSWARLCEFLVSFGAPDLSSEALATAGSLALETLSVALLGVALGFAFAYPLALGAARSVLLVDAPRPGLAGLASRASCELCRLLLDVLRGVPDFAWALLIANFAGIGAITGVLAIAVSVAGILGKVLSEQWDNVPPERYAALRSTGAGRLAVFLYGIQPLSARAMTSFVLMRTECAIRNASVIGVIAGGGLGSGLWDAFKDSRYDFVVTLLLAMLALTASADVLANLLRAQLRVDPNHPRAGNGGSRTASARRRGIGAIAVLAMLIGCAFALRTPFARFLDELQRIDGPFAWTFARRLLLSPDPAAIPAAIRESFVPVAVALLTTVAASLLAGLLAWPASATFQLHGARITGERLGPFARARRWLLVVTARGIALLCRGVPEVAWVLILGAFFRQGLLAGVLAVAVHSTGVLLRVFVETIDNVPYRRLEQVSGACRSSIFAYAALPTALADWKTYVFFQFEVNLRMGIVLGMIGAGGLGEAFDGNFRFDRLERAGTFLWTMVLLTVLVDRTSRWLQLRRRRC